MYPAVPHTDRLSMSGTVVDLGEGGLCFLWVNRHFCEKNVLYGKNTSHHSTVVLHLSQGVLGSVRGQFVA